MNHKPCTALVCLLSIVYQGMQAQCITTLTKSGKGCAGDTLTITGLNIASIKWRRGNHVIRNDTPTYHGIIVAGGNYIGIDSSQLWYPTDVSVDKQGNVYVCDQDNQRIQKWAPKAKYGITIAGQKNGKYGSDSVHFFYPQGIYLDSNSNLYVSDGYNNRVMKWTYGSKYGTRIAGSNNTLSGTDAAYLDQPSGVFVDKKGNLYVADYYNHRVQKWSPGAKKGTTVAGQKIGGFSNFGKDSSRLHGPTDVFVDDSGNVFVADGYNNRVQKWVPGKGYGITVAGQKDSMPGSDSVHLNFPTGVFLDGNGNIYITDGENNRVQKWASGSAYGVTVAGDKKGNWGSDLTRMSLPMGLYVDSTGAVYVCDARNSRVLKWTNTEYTSITADTVGLYSAIVTYKSGCIDTTNSILIKGINTDTVNTKICLGRSYSLGGYAYKTAGVYYQHYTNTAGCDSTIILNLGVYQIMSVDNARICPGQYYSFSGSTYSAPGTYKVGFTTKSGCDSLAVLNLNYNNNETYISATICSGDSYLFNGSSNTHAGIYKVHLKNMSGCDSVVTLYLDVNKPILSQSGPNCAGDTLKVFLNYAAGVWWMENGSLVKADGLKIPQYYGINVAGQAVGGHLGYDSVHLFAPAGIFIDSALNLYIADAFNCRVQKWVPGANYGVTVAGQKNNGNVFSDDSMHLYTPQSVFVDKGGNVYVADADNNRIQKWAPGAKYGTTVAGQKKGGILYGYGNDSVHLHRPTGITFDSAGNLYIADNLNNRVQKYAPGATYGITVAGQKDGTPGADSAHLNGTSAICLDPSGNIYVADAANNRIQKWRPGATYGITVAGKKNGASGDDSASLYNPSAILVDSRNNMYIADAGNSRVQKWSPGAEYGYTVAGMAKGGYLAHGGDSAHLYTPEGLFLDKKGSLYVSEWNNDRVSKWDQSGQYSIVVSSPGKYIAIVNYGNGCVTGTDTIQIYDCANGIKERSNRGINISITPNPNKGNFKIDITSLNYTNKAHIQVVNMLGQIVEDQVVDNANGKIQYIISNNQLAEGVYLVKTTIGVESYSQKIIVAK